MEMKKKLWYNRIEFTIIVALFIIMICINFCTVITRYFFSYTASWAEQLSRFMFVWITYAGVSWGGSINAHLRVFALCELLGDKIGYWILYLADIVTVLFGLFMGTRIWGLMVNAFRLNQTFASMQWCNVGFMYLAGVLGMCGLSIRIIQSRYIMFYKGRSEKKERNKEVVS